MVKLRIRRKRKSKRRRDNPAVPDYLEEPFEERSYRVYGFTIIAALVCFLASILLMLGAPDASITVWNYAFRTEDLCLMLTIGGFVAFLADALT